MIVNLSRVALARGEAPKESSVLADAIAEVGVLIAAANIKTANGCRNEDAVALARQLLQSSRMMDEDAAARR